MLTFVILYSPFFIYVGIKYQFLKRLKLREYDFLELLSPFADELNELDLAIFVGKYGSWIAFSNDF